MDLTNWALRHFLINFSVGNIVTLLAVKGMGMKVQPCGEGHVMSLHDLYTR